MKLYEYLGKYLFKRYRIPAPDGRGVYLRKISREIEHVVKHSTLSLNGEGGNFIFVEWYVPRKQSYMLNLNP